MPHGTTEGSEQWRLLMRESNHKGRTYQGKPITREGIDRDKVQAPRKVTRFGEPMTRAAVTAEWRKGSK